MLANLKQKYSSIHYQVNFLQYFDQFLPNDTHLFPRHFLYLDGPDDRGETGFSIFRMFARCGLIKLAHLKISILHLNPSETILNFHLDGSILDLFHFSILFFIFLNNLHSIRYFFLQLFNLKGRIIQLPINLL